MRLNELKSLLNEHTCVVLKGETVDISNQRGIRPVIDWLKEDARFFEGAEVADRVIGKAAAMLLCYGGVKSVFAGVISEPALCILRENGVAYRYDTLVPYIENRDKTGRCPMETCALPLTSLEEAYRVFMEL